MIATWWLDAVVLTLLVVLAYLFYRLEANSVDPDSKEPEWKEPESKRWSPYPARLIRQAGLRPQSIAPLYWSAKLLLGLAVALIVVELSLGKAPVGGIMLASLTGFGTTDAWLLIRRRKRKRAISASLSFFINLIVVYLRSGMNLAQAFQQAARYGLTPAHPLAQEVLLLGAEIQAGRDRDSAFALLAERTGVDALKQLAALMNVGFRVGSPVRETLQAQAELLKARQAQAVTQLINRKSMEAMLPMMLVCFPMFVVLILFPAAIQVMDVLALIKEIF